LVKKILFVQLNWSIVQFSVDLVNLLKENDCEVEILITDQSISPYADIYNTQTRVFNIVRKYKYFYHYFRNFWKILSRLVTAINPVDPLLRRGMSKYLKDRYFDDVILVENESLIAFDSSPYKYNVVSTLYHSLELYIEDHELFSKHRNLILEGRRALRGIDGIIIQDQDRYFSLCNNSHISSKFVFYPVGCIPCDMTNSKVIANNLLNNIGVNPSAKIILSIGNISKKRCFSDILKLAHDIGEGYVFILHGKVLDSLDRSDIPDNIVFSNSILTEIELASLISISTIGLSFYRTDNLNESLTAFSSHRIAMYLRGGLPIISFKTPSYERLFKAYKCGLSINSANDAKKNVERISVNFDKYSHQAILAYNDFYNSKKTVANILDVL
jgi:hypothetical protein